MLARSQVSVVRENRRFVRVKPSGMVSRVGKIIVDPKKPTIDCNIIDLSAGGACLEINDNDRLIPKRFVLLHSGTKKSCIVVWKIGRRFGVAF